MTPSGASSKSKKKSRGILFALRDLFQCVNEVETAHHYCRRLAAIVLLPNYRDTFSNSLTCAERERVLKEPVGWKQLAQRLEMSPRLQSIAASCTSYTPSVWLLEQELIARGRHDPGCNLPPDENATEVCGATALDVYRLARTVNSSGLCFSGGGIRSATFNLGVLQGLAKLELLEKFDYLSTVSGGGYIHQFLAAWLYNRNCLLSDGTVAKRPALEQSSSATSTPIPPLQEVQHQLKPLPQGARVSSGAMTQQPEPIRWLRRFSNYLTPNKGLFTTDTWVMVSIWLRNAFLNQLTLVSLLSTFLLIPHLIRGLGGLATLHHLYKWAPSTSHPFFGYLLPSLLIVGLGACSCWLVTSQLRIARQGRLDPDDPVCQERKSAPRIKNTAERSGVGRWILLLCLLTCIAAIASPALYQSSFVGVGSTQNRTSQSFQLVSDGQNAFGKQESETADRFPSREMRTGLSHNPSSFGRYSYPTWLHIHDSALLVEIAFLLFTFAFSLSSGLASLASRPGFGGFWCVVGGLVGAASTWVALYVTRIGIFWLCFRRPEELPQIAVVVLPVCVLSAFFLALVLGAGIVGRRTDGSLREAMARLRALAFLLSIMWVGISGCSLLGSFFFHSLAITSAKYWHWKEWTALFTWVGGTVGGVLAGNNEKSYGKSDGSGLVMKILVKIGPPIFIIGIVILLSQVLQMILNAVGGDWGWGLIWTFLAFLGSTLLFGFRLDINDFSMHAFYRDRLARCYSGASYPHRRANRFTGFAQSDGEIRVADLLPARFQKARSAGIMAEQITDLSPYPGPFPIFCTTVNLTFGQDLAWQERKGASFAFTPLYSGYSPGWTADSGAKEKRHHSYNGFVSTRTFAYEDHGIPMHSAVAISGAAVSPDMGYHSDPAMAFLLTMFNVRLGWWIRNPRVTSTIRLFSSPSPLFPLWNLFSELLGRATDMSNYVYLTDGGHFDNMGLYELVRRRCRRILICDAEQDSSNSFEGIGSAIRKCRVDFGVDIDLNLAKLDPGLATPDSVPSRPTTLSHFVQGTITYPEDDEKGTILYIKTRVTGDESADVLNYNREHAEFPNESTMNQWFSESQFESYRNLGYHSVLHDPQRMDTPLPVTMVIHPDAPTPGGHSAATLSVSSPPPAAEEPLREILLRVFSPQKTRASE